MAEILLPRQIHRGIYVSLYFANLRLFRTKGKEIIKRLKTKELFSFSHYMSFSDAIREINETHFLYSEALQKSLDLNEYITLHQSNLKRGNQQARCSFRGMHLHGSDASFINYSGRQITSNTKRQWYSTVQTSQLSVSIYSITLTIKTTLLISRFVFFYLPCVFISTRLLKCLFFKSSCHSQFLWKFSAKMLNSILKICRKRRRFSWKGLKCTYNALKALLKAFKHSIFIFRRIR